MRKKVCKNIFIIRITGLCLFIKLQPASRKFLIMQVYQFKHPSKFRFTLYSFFILSWRDKWVQRIPLADFTKLYVCRVNWYRIWIAEVIHYAPLCVFLARTMCKKILAPSVDFYLIRQVCDDATRGKPPNTEENKCGDIEVIKKRFWSIICLLI